MDSRESQIRSLAKQIIQVGTQRNTSLHLYGKPIFTEDRQINHIYTNIIIDNEQLKPEDSLQVLAQVFDAIPGNICLQVHMIYFHHYSTSNNIKLEFPRNLGRTMPNVQFCTISDCVNLSSLDCIVEQFLNLNVLTCCSCENITSLGCLSSIPNESLLTKVYFDDCGLQSVSDDWRNGLIRLGRNIRNDQPEGITLSIANCNLLTHIPPSIKFLAASDRNVQFNLFLSNNKALQKLPLELGELNLSCLVLFDCPKLQSVPWTLGRFPDCSFGFCGKTSEELSHALKNAKHDPGSLELPMSELQPYFKASLKRFFIGIVRLKILLHREGQLAIERLYRPGGKGFRKSKDNFYRYANAEYRSRKKVKTHHVALF